VKQIKIIKSGKYNIFINGSIEIQPQLLVFTGIGL